MRSRPASRLLVIDPQGRLLLFRFVHRSGSTVGRVFPLELFDGEIVEADERFFVVRVADNLVSNEGWTALEREVMAEHRWWTAEELDATEETVWPSNIAEMLREQLER